MLLPLTRILVLCVVVLVSVGLPQESPGQNVLIPLTTRRDMVFDHSGNYLYITTSDGFVRRYDLATNQIDMSYNLGGSLNGLDIAPDDSFLLVAQKNLQNSQVTIHRLNLANGAITNIGFVPTYMEHVTGTWDVGIASNGIALVTMYYGGSGFSYIHQIDLATNDMTIRHDVPGSAYDNVTSRAQIHRGADGTRLYFLEGDISSAPVFFYDATTNTFGLRTQTRGFTDSFGAAVSRDGRLIATQVKGYGTALDKASDLTFIHNFRDPDGGVVFAGKRDTLYAVNSLTNRIVAYDTTTFTEKSHLIIGEPIGSGVAQFGTGNIVASEDGRYLALGTPSGIRLFATANELASPTVVPTFGTVRDLVFDHAGQFLYMTTAEGLVWPYNLATRSLGIPYDLGGSLTSVDIAADDSFLLVGQSWGGIAEGAFLKVDLLTGAVANINFTHTPGTGEWGAWDVAITSNGFAFLTTGANSGAHIPLRQLDLSTNVLSFRTDGPGGSYSTGGQVYSGTSIDRNANGTLLYFVEGGSYVYNYSSRSDSWGPLKTKNDCYSASTAVNRDGSLLGTRLRNTTYSTMDGAPSFNFIHRFNNVDSGIAFDALQDSLYGINSSTDQIVAFDTNTFAEKFRFDIGEDIQIGATQFGPGTLVASQDGHYLAVITPTTFRVFAVPAVELVSVDSMKEHGASGPFSLSMSLDTARGTEPRSGGPNGDYTLTFTFGQGLKSVGAANISRGTATIISGGIDQADQHRYVVNLTGVSNGQYLKITLRDVTDVEANHTDSISQQIGILVGDTNGDGVVNSADVSQVKSNSGNGINIADLRSDINCDGIINSADVSFVKSKIGSALPYLP